MMKVLHINKSDSTGGAARAAYRLHRALLEQGIDSKMLVQRKERHEQEIMRPSGIVDQLVYKLQAFMEERTLKFYGYSPSIPFSTNLISSHSMLRSIKEIDPDIIHLHWIGGGMLKIEDLSKIDKPIVWSLHDMWAFTGGCHYDDECRLYRNSCGNCKVLGSRKEDDLSKKTLHRKEKTFSKISNMIIIGLSKWLANCAKESTLFKDKKVVNLPNPIDTNRFQPFDQKKARELLNLPQKKKLIFFGAMNATSDTRKGFKELNEALDKLNATDVELVVFGSNESNKVHNFEFKTHYLGSLVDDITLQVLYNAADILVVPSLQENLSNVIMESLSCGVPVVGFDIGGNSDMIEHKKNGYLAQPFSSDDLARGIEWVINHKDHNLLSCNAREKVLQEFDSNFVAKRYIELYKEVYNG